MFVCWIVQEKKTAIKICSAVFVLLKSITMALISKYFDYFVVDVVYVKVALNIDLLVIAASCHFFSHQKPLKYFVYIYLYGFPTLNKPFTIIW